MNEEEKQERKRERERERPQFRVEGLKGFGGFRVSGFRVLGLKGLECRVGSVRRREATNLGFLTKATRTTSNLCAK